MKKKYVKYLKILFRNNFLTPSFLYLNLKKDKKKILSRNLCVCMFNICYVKYVFLACVYLLFIHIYKYAWNLNDNVDVSQYDDIHFLALSFLQR